MSSDKVYRIVGYSAIVISKITSVGPVRDYTVLGYPTTWGFTIMFDNGQTLYHNCTIQEAANIIREQIIDAINQLP